MYPEIPPPRIRKRRNWKLLSKPPPVSPLPIFAPPISQNRYAGSSNSTSPGWNTDSNEELHKELRRLRGMISNNAPSHEPRPPQGPAYCVPDVDGPYDASILRQTEVHAEAGNSFHYATPYVAPVEVDAAPDASSKSGVIQDEFEFKDNASKVSSIDKGRHKETDAYSDAYNVPMRPPTLPLTVNKHDVPTGGTQLQQQQQPAAPLSQWREYSGPLPDLGVSFEASLLRPSGGLKSWKRTKSLARRVNTQDSSSIEPPAKKKKRSRQPVAKSEQYQDANVEEDIRGEEKKRKLELPEPAALHSSTPFADNQREISSDMTKSAGDSATSSYKLPQIHDGQTNTGVQHYDAGKQVEGVALPSDAGTRGPMELQHSGLGTDDGTSSVRILSSTQSSSGPADFTEIVRSFQPQTELLNPCAKINEFILITHPHASVAITHSDEWSSALSQGDGSDDLLRVLSDFKVIVHDGVASLEAR
ncbi:hypothetical protein EDD18DRAFT_1144273 [Armillaria luteobubalina]|uniref:Uncharacterized protein n=1 Tax=Armillaria luteobubalina TaxID=153913 RepID=A0AA39QHI1_9AGAR|nr:hypothetical protein EDD18DRAFT_1144273 [Armillaria luteobubalina]